MRISVQILLFLVFLNAWALAISEAGIDEDLGIDPETTESQELKDAEQRAEDFQTGRGGGSTLFALYNSLAGTLRVLVDPIFPAAEMLGNIPGIPQFFIDFLMSGATIVAALDLMGFLRTGRVIQ